MLPNRLEIQYRQLAEREKEYHIEANYIQVSGMENPAAKEKINRLQEEYAKQFLKDPAFIASAKKSYTKDAAYPAVKHCEVYVSANFSGVLSLRYHGGKSIPSGLGGQFYAHAFNFDVETENELRLKDLFREEVDYKKIMNEYIKTQITRLYPGEKLYRAFTGITDQTPFYFNETTLFIYFLPGELLEASRGPVEFDIPFSVFGEGGVKILE